MGSVQAVSSFFWIGFPVLIASEGNSSENWLRVAIPAAVPWLWGHLAFFCRCCCSLQVLFVNLFFKQPPQAVFTAEFSYRLKDKSFPDQCDWFPFISVQLQMFLG